MWRGSKLGQRIINETLVLVCGFLGKLLYLSKPTSGCWMLDVGCLMLVLYVAFIFDNLTT